MTILKRDKRNDEWRVFMSSVASRLPDGSWGYMGFKSDKWKNMHQEKYRSNLVERKFAPRCNQLVGWNIHSYCCPHAFSYGDRTVESLYALQSIVLDIDCHSERYCKSLRNYRIQTLAHILIHDADDYGLPEPNFIVFTGRGLQVWWNHESMSARKCLNTWKSIVCCFIEIVNKMIADHSEGDPQDTIRGLAVDEQASLNPVGLFRIPGTYNPKAKACAYSVDGVDPNYIYTYQDLVRFRNEYRAEKPIAPQKSKKRFQVPGCSWDISSWADTTALKIESLRDIRNGDIGNETRNNFCVALYCLYRSAGMEDLAAMERLHAFNEGFKRPMQEKELKSTLSSARRKLYQYSANALIQLLDISEKEASFIGLKYGTKKMKSDKKLEIKARNREIIQLYKTGMTQAEVGERMGINRKTVGDVLRNAGIDRAGTKAKKIISLREKGLSTGQIADKIGCTERNIYRILQNAASKSAGGAPEAARTGIAESVALTSTEKDASMSAETFNVTNEIICEQSVMMSLNNGTATESGIPVNAPDSSSNNLSSETSVPGDFCFTPGSAFLSPGTEGMLPQSYNNGYLSCRGSVATRLGGWLGPGQGLLPPSLCIPSYCSPG